MRSGLGTNDDLNSYGIVVSDYAQPFCNVDTDTDEISDESESTAQVPPNWLDPRNTEQYRVH
jgi:hypothetical protein